MAYNPQNPNGKAVMANSQPVTIASDQPAPSVEESIQELVSRLSFLAAVRGTAADIRVTLLSGVLTSVGTVTTVTTVTTVGTVSNQTNMGGYNAALPVIANVNMAAVLSNINNIY